MAQFDHRRAGEFADLADAGIGAGDGAQLRPEIIAVGRAVVVEEAGGAVQITGDPNAPKFSIRASNGLLQGLR